MKYEILSLQASKKEKIKHFFKVILENFIKLEYLAELAGQDCFG